MGSLLQIISLLSYFFFLPRDLLLKEPMVVAVFRRDQEGQHPRFLPLSISCQLKQQNTPQY